ncbi:MAG: Branched-chain-amino-acid aminotransferase [Phycisphaerae bacterium]|nr:Branched-chain-amino-acid aminotransferase [Phycisphaerae bacterium]
MNEWVCLNGEVLPASEASVSVFDSGFTQGVGLFETMRARGRRVFRLGAHLDRLARSARTLGWTTIPDVDEMRSSVGRVIAAGGAADQRVRLTVTTGTLRATGDEQPRLTYVATSAANMPYPAEYFQRGVTVTISRYRQSAFDPTTGHKTTSYIARLASLREAYERQCFEALWFTIDNTLAEGAISSVFLVRDEALLTPPVTTPVLPGITRGVLLELAVEHRIAFREQSLTIDDLLGADEIFLTNSMMGLMPVVRIERAVIGDEKPGPLTRRLAGLYDALIDADAEADDE